MASEHDRRLAEYERQVGDLQAQLKTLEEEVVVLRRRLQDAPKRVRTLEERLLETKGQLAQAVSQNERLSATLREAREHIAALREEVEKLTMPPSAYGTFLGSNDDGTVDVLTRGPQDARRRCTPRSSSTASSSGQEVALNESLNVVLARGAEVAGEVVVLKELLAGGTRALVIGRADEERVCELSEDLIGEKLRAGDHVLIDMRSSLLIERLPRPEVEELVLEEVPDVTYADVGGLDDQIEHDPGRGRAAVPLRGPVPRAQAAAAEGHPAVRPSRLREDAHREGGRELAGAARRGEDRQRRLAPTSSTSRARSSSTSTSARPSARFG